MRLLFDTNRYSQADRGDTKSIERLETATELWASVVMLAELRYGFAVGGRRQENEANLRDFLATKSVRVVGVDEETSLYFSSVRHGLRKIGKPIPTNDIWLAAQALQHNLVLDSEDAHFDWVEGLLRP